MKNEFNTGMPEMNTSNKTDLDRSEMTWVLDEKGCLTVSGTGRMADFSCGHSPAAPWADEKERILEVVIGEGITRIGVNAFADCSNLRRVSLPRSLRRIGAYAFQNCTSLQELDPENTVYRYCYEPGTSVGQESFIVFGIGSFFNTPWALHRWGSFYCVDGTIYAAFSAEEHLTVPETCHALQKFAFSGTTASSIELPGTLEDVQGFAFYGCPVKSVTIPSSVKYISLTAFTNSSLENIEFPDGIREIRFGDNTENTEEKADAQTGKESEAVYEMPGFYRVSRKAYRSCPAFERILLFCKAVEPEMVPFKSKKKTVSEETADPTADESRAVQPETMPDKSKKETTSSAASDPAADEQEAENRPSPVPSVLVSAHIPFEVYLYTKICSGDIFLCVEHKDNKVVCVRSFALNERKDRIRAYRMRPSRNIGLPVIWEDSYEYLDEADFLLAMQPYSFHSQANERPAVRGIFYRTVDGSGSEWFRFTKKSRPLLSGELELNLLDQWLKHHSRKRISTAEENIQEDRLSESGSAGARWGNDQLQFRSGSLEAIHPHRKY